jgi:SecD/SecF fusion protein
MEVAAREWRLTVDALARPSQMARMDTISRTIADTFAAQAVVSVLISLVLLTVYVWVRFGAGRWAVAATVPLFADVVGILGLIALAQILYETPSTQGFAAALGILPFKIDLAQIAALLTITGYSLNDKIIIMDRIRENKGKLPYASYKVINDSINQTLSRTFITSGTTLFSTIALYLYGGEGIRGFAFAFTFGVIIGTYTSIVSSPLVWSRKYDKPTTPATPSETPAVAGAAGSLPGGGTGGSVVR